MYHLPSNLPNYTGRPSLAGFGSIYTHVIRYTQAINHFFPPRKDGCRRRRLIFQIKSKIILDPMAYVGLEPGSYFCCRLVARTSATCPRSVRWWTRRRKVPGGRRAPSSYSLLKSLAPPVGVKRYCCQSIKVYLLKQVIKPIVYLPKVSICHTKRIHGGGLPWWRSG